MAAVSRRIALFDPARRLGRDVGPIASGAGLEVVEITRAADLDAELGADALLIAPAVASEVGPAPVGGAVRWIGGDATHAGRLAGAAASGGAAGVLLQPIAASGLVVAVGPELVHPEAEMSRARLLIAASVMDANQASLTQLAEAFGASDAIVWWKEGETMTPESARGVD